MYVDKLSADKTRLEEQVSGKAAELVSLGREKDLLNERISDLTAKFTAEIDQVGTLFVE